MRMQPVLPPPQGPRRWFLVCICCAAVSACAGTQVNLTADDDRATARVQDYLNALQRFTADFTQTGSDGPAEGYVWLERPGRLRVEYVRPRPKLVLANHGRLLLADRLTGGTTMLPVSRTPLNILLAGQIQLSGSITVTAVRLQPDAVQISLVKAATPNQGTLTLQFSDNPLTLIGVVVQDSTGRTNTLALTNLNTGADIAPARFTYQPDPVR